MNSTPSLPGQPNVNDLMAAVERFGQASNAMAHQAGGPSFYDAKDRRDKARTEIHKLALVLSSPSPAAPAVQDERGMFEAWAHPAGYDISTWGVGGAYQGRATISAWHAWQARSLLSPSVGGKAADGLLREAKAILQDIRGRDPVWWGKNFTRVETLIRAIDESAALPAADGGDGEGVPKLPEGYRLLPVEATDSMMDAEWAVSMSDAHSSGGVSAAAWRAMVEAAPQVTYGKGHSGLGWYAHDTEYPEEGAEFLGASAPSASAAAGKVTDEQAKDAARFRAYWQMDRTTSNALVKLELRAISGDRPTLDEWRAAMDEVLASPLPSGSGTEPNGGQR